MTIDKNNNLMVYEVSLSKCPHCASKLHMSASSKYLKSSIENIILISKVHLSKCSMNDGSKKVATIKIITTEEGKGYTSKKVEDNLILI